MPKGYIGTSCTGMYRVYPPTASPRNKETHSLFSIRPNQLVRFWQREMGSLEADNFHPGHDVLPQK